MVNVKPKIYKALCNVTENVSDAYPKDWTNFPIVQYVEEENTPHIITASGEEKSYLRYKVDVWNNASTSTLAAEICGEFNVLGWKRCQCTDVPDLSGYKHKLMRFECVIDRKGNVYYP